jgi:hypothetical protein
VTTRALVGESIVDIDRAALGPKLVALLQQAVGLVECASLVEQFAQRRARQPGGVGVDAAGPLADLDGPAEAAFRRRRADPLFQSRWFTMLITLPSGARTKNRRTPHGSVVIGCTIS